MGAFSCMYYYFFLKELVVATFIQHFVVVSRTTWKHEKIFQTIIINYKDFTTRQGILVFISCWLVTNGYV